MVEVKSYAGPSHTHEFPTHKSTMIPWFIFFALQLEFFLESKPVSVISSNLKIGRTYVLT